MRKVVTLTGKNLPRLSVGKPGWPERFQPSEDDILAALKFEQRRINQEHADAKAAADFTRVCDEMGLKTKRPTTS